MTQGDRSSRYRPAWLLPLAPILVVVAVVTYGFGILVILVSEDDEACAKGIIHERAGFVRLDEGYLPLHSTCVFEDGETYEELPGWVNPVFFLSMAGAVVCWTLAARTASRRRDGL